MVEMVISCTVYSSVPMVEMDITALYTVVFPW